MEYKRPCLIHPEVKSVAQQFLSLPVTNGEFYLVALTLSTYLVFGG